MIELILRRRDSRHYTLEMTFSQPEIDADVRPLREAAVIRFDHERLRALLPDYQAYGRELFNQLLPRDRQPERSGDLSAGPDRC